jgi:3-phenylpropionate/trans-cinnamate dioxygenase ferredoxin reductase subunit
VLRTLDDSIALKAALDEASSLLVVGGGFIGAEVATVARERGVAVTVLEAAPVPAVRALGPELGALLARLITENGVDLRTGVTITGFPDVGKRVAAQLSDGTVVEADIAVVGVGGAPEVAWVPAEGPGGEVLDLSNGLACGTTGRVAGLPGVWAVGDVANWSQAAGGSHRMEHWTSAGEEALVVARDILGAEPPPEALPYVWSDQFGMKIQQIGLPHRGEEIVALHGEGLDGGPIRGTVAAHFDGDRIVGVTGFGAPRFVVRYRASVLAGASRDEVLATAEALSQPRR